MKFLCFRMSIRNKENSDNQIVTFTTIGFLLLMALTIPLICSHKSSITDLASDILAIDIKLDPLD